MADTIAIKAKRRARHNFKEQLESLRVYIETKIEVLEETEVTEDLASGQLAALRGVLKRIVQ